MGNTNKKLALEQREVVLVNVEELMVKGIFGAGEIAKSIGCSIPTAREYIKAIKKRWETENGRDFLAMRAELFQKTRRLESAYWEAVENADNSSARIGALNGIMGIQKYQAHLAGID